MEENCERGAKWKDLSLSAMFEQQGRNPYSPENTSLDILSISQIRQLNNMFSFFRTVTTRLPAVTGTKGFQSAIASVKNGGSFHAFSTNVGVRYAAAVTKPAPTFSGTAVVDGEFKQIKLEDYKGKYLVLFFYPLDFTFVCPTEIIAFSERMNEFTSLNTAIVGVSVDSQFSHLAWINTDRKKGGLGKMNYPLLSDITKSISRDYGVLLEDGGISLRGLFIIDPKGVVRQITVNDLPVGRSVDETLRLVKAFQFVEKHGEVCPADWSEGKPSMKADPVKSREYFEKVNK